MGIGWSVYIMGPCRKSSSVGEKGSMEPLCGTVLPSLLMSAAVAASLVKTVVLEGVVFFQPFLAGVGVLSGVFFTFWKETFFFLILKLCLM